jgi:hypothetical protein
VDNLVSNGQWELIRPTQQPVVHTVQLNDDGRVEALVAETNLDKLYDVDGSLVADYSGMTVTPAN